MKLKFVQKCQQVPNSCKLLNQYLLEGQICKIGLTHDNGIRFYDSVFNYISLEFIVGTWDVSFVRHPPFSLEESKIVAKELHNAVLLMEYLTNNPTFLERNCDSDEF